MSKLFFFFFVFILLSCETKKLSDAKESSNLQDERISVAKQTTDKFNLELSPELGKEYQFESRLEQKITQKIDTLNAVTNHHQKIIYVLRPIEQDTLNNFLFTVKFKIIQQNISSQLFTVDVNTQIKSKNETPLDIFYGNLIDKEFKLKVDKKGKKITLFGVDSLINSVINQMLKIKEFKGMDKSMLSQIVGSFFNQYELNKSFEKIFNIYPEQSVTTGSSWQIELSPIDPVPTKIVNTYTLNSLKNDSMFVNLSSTIQFNKEIIKESNPDLTEINGKQNGYLILDRRTGLVKDSKLIQQIKMVYKIPPSAQTNNKPLTIVTNVNSVFYLRLK